MSLACVMRLKPVEDLHHMWVSLVCHPTGVLALRLLRLVMVLATFLAVSWQIQLAKGIQVLLPCLKSNRSSKGRSKGHLPTRWLSRRKDYSKGHTSLASLNSQ